MTGPAGLSFGMDVVAELRRLLSPPEGHGFHPVALPADCRQITHMLVVLPIMTLAALLRRSLAVDLMRVKAFPRLFVELFEVMTFKTGQAADSLFLFGIPFV